MTAQHRGGTTQELAADFLQVAETMNPALRDMPALGAELSKEMVLAVQNASSLSDHEIIAQAAWARSDYARRIAEQSGSQKENDQVSKQDTNKLIAHQLHTLLKLTAIEAQIAQARQAQARTDAVRRKLAQNERDARTRGTLISNTLRDLGGVPDVVSPVLGRLSALLKPVAEQAEPLAGALLEDLALERQLFDRARYLKILTVPADNAKVFQLAERLESAHQATADWLSTVLADEALGGPTALRPTPLQAVAGSATRIVLAPARWSADGVNRAVATVKQRRDQAEKATPLKDEVAEKATQLKNATKKTLAAAGGKARRTAARKVKVTKKSVR